MEFHCAKCKMDRDSEANAAENQETEQQAKFSTLNELERHLAGDHFYCSPYQCESCKAKFCTESDVLMHVKDISSHIKYLCQVTPDITTKRAEIQKLLYQSIGVQQFTKAVCQKCSMEFDTISLLEGHLASEHFSNCAPFKCPHKVCKCGMFFTEKDAMTHEEEAHAPKRESSDQAGRKYSIPFFITPQIGSQRIQIRKHLQGVLLNTALEQSPKKTAPIGQDEASIHCLNEFDGSYDRVKKHLFYMLGKDEYNREGMTPVTGLGKYAVTCFHQMKHPENPAKLIAMEGIKVYRETDRTYKNGEIVHGPPIICKVANPFPYPFDVVYLEQTDGKPFCDELPLLLEPKIGTQFAVYGYGIQSFKRPYENIRDHWPAQLTGRLIQVEHAMKDAFGRITGNLPGTDGYSGAGCFTAEGSLLGIHQGSLGPVRSIIMGADMLSSLMMRINRLAEGYEQNSCTIYADDVCN